LIDEFYFDFFCRYKCRVKKQKEPETQHPGTLLRSRSHRNSQDHCQCDTINNETPDQMQLRQLIREEINKQRFMFERQTILDLIMNPPVPASPEFIAKFRMQHKQNPTLINSEMMEQVPKCMICMEPFELGSPCGRWPCPSTTSHIFHPKCMLKCLRRKNTCPICRHPVTPSQITNDTFGQFIVRLVF
jgi:hypothetical protein